MILKPMQWLLGWRMYYPGYWSPSARLKSDSRLAAVNGRIQSTAAGLFKLFMIEVQEDLLACSAISLVPVHDELGISCTPDVVEVLFGRLQKKAVEIGMNYLGVPMALTGTWGPSWGEAKIPVEVPF